MPRLAITVNFSYRRVNFWLIVASAFHQNEERRNGRRHSRVSIRIAVAVSLTAIASVPAEAAPRPIGDFLEAQGTYCVDFDGLPGCDLFFRRNPT